MEAKVVYDKLNKDFLKEGIRDIGWTVRMPLLWKHFTNEFCTNSGKGLMLDFAFEINEVYTMVFLEERLLDQLLATNVTDALILSHHPTAWDIEKRNGNYAIDEEYCLRLKQNRIAVYILHQPLDDYGPYSTARTLAEQLPVTIERPAFKFQGAMCGLIATTSCNTITELQKRFSTAVGHRVSLYRYGNKQINEQKVAVCPGGGNQLFVIQEMLKNNTKTLITGVSLINEHSSDVHKYAKKHRVNVLGGTHYSTEKFAMMRMVEYFEALGLPARFLADEPQLYDLGRGWGRLL